MVRKGSPVRVRRWAPEGRLLRHLAPRPRAGAQARRGAARAAGRRGLRPPRPAADTAPARAPRGGRRARRRGRARCCVGRLVLPAGAPARPGPHCPRGRPRLDAGAVGPGLPAGPPLGARGVPRARGARRAPARPVGARATAPQRRAPRRVRAALRLSPLRRALAAVAPAPAAGLRPPGLPLYVSGDWPTLNRRALRAVLGFPARRPELMRRYRRSFAAAESLFATALVNEPGLSVGGGPHRWIDFPAGAPNPRTLTSADLPALEASGAHFARKFDPAVDAEVLEALDRLRAERSGRASLGRRWPAETSESP